VSRIHIVDNNVVCRCSNHTALRNLSREEYNVGSEEVLNIVHSKGCLHCDLCAAEIVVYVQSIDKCRYSGSLPVHLFKCVLYTTDRHSKSHLESVFLRCELTSQQEVVELRHYFILQLS